MPDTALVLVVDDNFALQQIAVRALSRAGYRTCTADDGQAALRLARSEEPDLILLDVMLPDISGFDVCRQLKADPALTGCLVLMLSCTQTASPNQIDGLDAGADGFIARPIPNDELLARVRSLLRIKQVESRLRDSEKRLQEVLEHSLDASYKRNLHTDAYDYLSPVFARLSGYTPDEMKTLPSEASGDLIHPDDRAEVDRVVAESLFSAAGTAHQVEYRFKHKDDRYRWFHDRFTVVRDAEGRPLARIGSVSDITDRKQLEESLHTHQIELELQNEDLRRMQAELAASRERYCDLYELAPVGYLSVNEQGLILEANRNATTLLGMAQGGKPLPLPFSRFILKEDQEIYYWNRKRLLETGQPQACELRMVKQAGTAFWAQLDASAAPAVNGKSLHRIVLHDITARKQAEETLRDAHWRLESIIEGTHAGTWEWNVQTGETVFNPMWAQIVGYTPEELAPISLKTWPWSRPTPPREPWPLFL